jgi:hypothetical protein
LLDIEDIDSSKIMFASKSRICNMAFKNKEEIGINTMQIGSFSA